MKTIPSLMTLNKKSWAFIQDDAKGRIPMKWWNKAPLRVKAMWHWLDWNQRAEEMAEIHWTLDSATELGTILAEKRIPWSMLELARGLAHRYW